MCFPFFIKRGVMPTYEYRCSECGHSLEALQKITEEPLKRCPQCRQDTLKRGPGGGIGLLFRGSGFYQTDYCCHHSDGECKNKEGKSKKSCCCKEKD